MLVSWLSVFTSTLILSYLDDELPDYIMVMVANKRSRCQMTKDLNLFLSKKTSTFVNWLQIVLKKLREVSVTNPGTFPFHNMLYYVLYVLPYIVLQIIVCFFCWISSIFWWKYYQEKRNHTSEFNTFHKILNSQIKIRHWLPSPYCSVCFVVLWFVIYILWFNHISSVSPII